MMDTELLLRYISDDLADTEREAVYRWITDSEQHMAEFRSLRRLYDLGLWRTDDCSVIRTRRVAGFWRKHRAGIWASAAAVMSAACLVLAVMFFTKKEPEGLLAEFDSVTAPAGKDLSLTLTDGTVVWLNSNSTLRIDRDPEHEMRRVALDGEAYFKVAKDPSHPFIVETDIFDVKVLGTEFDISSYGGETWSASLMQGSVAITRKTGEEITVLKPMTKAEYKDGGLVISYVNSDSYLWREGILFFDNLPLKDIFTGLAKHFDLRIDLSSYSGGDARYTGKFRTVDGYEHILKVLQMDNDFDFRIIPSQDNVTVIIR